MIEQWKPELERRRNRRWEGSRRRQESNLFVTAAANFLEFS
jgi:hypothetical protein